MQLHDVLESVKDQSSFLGFVSLLAADRRAEVEKESLSFGSPYTSGANGWENQTIESFLESAVAWAKDSDFGLSQGVGKNPWKQFATFLYCGKIYE